MYSSVCLRLPPLAPTLPVLTPPVLLLFADWKRDLLVAVSVGSVIRDLLAFLTKTQKLSLYLSFLPLLLLRFQRSDSASSHPAALNATY